MGLLGPSWTRLWGPSSKLRTSTRERHGFTVAMCAGDAYCGIEEQRLGFLRHSTEERSLDACYDRGAPLLF